MLVYGQKGPQNNYYKFKSKFNNELMLVYGQKGPQKYYYKFKSKFNTELMLVYGKKGPEKFYYKFKSKFNIELLLVYGQKGPATDVMLHYVNMNSHVCQGHHFGIGYSQLLFVWSKRTRNWS